MKKAFSILFLVGILFLSSSFVFQKEIDDIRWTIIPISNSKRVFEQCSRSSPKYSRVIQLDSSSYFIAINELKTKRNILLDSAGINLEDYTMQLVGFKRKNRKFIYFNANTTDFDFEKKSNWKENPIIWCDSNKASWGLVYDIEKDHFVDFVTNGPSMLRFEKL
jgi:hypothetical protein